MSTVVISYAILILISLLATAYTLWAYQHCPENKSHRPLVFPLICSIAWFLVAVEQLVAYGNHTHGTVDGITMLLLISATLASLLYFIKAYILCKHSVCPIPEVK